MVNQIQEASPQICLNQCLYLPPLPEAQKKKKKKEAEKPEFEFLPTPSNFSEWKMNFKGEVCSGANSPREGIKWINEFDSTQSVDDLKTSE